MTNEENIQAERSEINLLIEKGVNISVERTIRKKKKGLAGFIGKKIAVTELLKFTIKEPTLAVLDLIASEQLDLNMSEEEMASDVGVQKAKILSKEQNVRMARIVAISVLGEDYFICEQHGNGSRYKYDDKRLDELTELFNKHVKPSKLLQYCVLINTMSNLGDFINSIRLMSAARTTMPTRIEQNKEV